MNNTDRKRLSRLYGALNDVPMPLGRGSRSATVVGYATYGNDMQELKPLFSKLLLEIRDQDPRSGDDPEATLDEIEAYIARRKAENWG